MTVVVGAGLLGGCVDLSRPNTPKAQFGIAVERGEPVSPSRWSGAVRVAPVRVAPPSDGRMFVYRVGEHEYATDYFNVFVADPDSLLTGGLVDTLSAQGLFGAVVGPSGVADAALRLETTVTALHADLRDRSAPSAVLRARFALLREAPGQTLVMGEWVIEHDEPVGSRAPEDLAAGWGRGWSAVLARLGSELVKALGL